MSEKTGTIFTALTSKNYRLFFTGQSISLTGMWLQRVAMGWLVYRLTDSAFLLGAVDFSSQICMLFLGTFTGVMVERWDLRRVIIICQALCMVHAATLAILTLTGTVQYWHVISLGVFLGIINAFELPARQTFVVQLVEKPEYLGNAVALNSSLFNVARLVGPSIAGFAIASFGEGFCFSINSICYLATLAALFAMKLPPHENLQKDEKTHILEDLSEGLKYVRNFPPIRGVLVNLSILSFFGLPYLVLLPVFAKEILSGGPNLLGFLLGASGIGALAASIHFALRKSPVGLLRTMALSLSGLGLSVAIFGTSSMPYLSIFLIIPVGFCMVATMVAGNTILQTLVDEDKRGRVMSLYVISLMGIAPLGSLASGYFASMLGAPATLVAGGTVCLIAGLSFLSKEKTMWSYAKLTYEKKGLMIHRKTDLKTVDQTAKSLS